MGNNTSSDDNMSSNDAFSECVLDVHSKSLVDLLEMKCACQALGLYPNFPKKNESKREELKIKNKMKKLNIHFPLNKGNFRELTEALSKDVFPEDFSLGMPVVPLWTYP